MQESLWLLWGEQARGDQSGGTESTGEAAAVVQVREEADLTWAESRSDGEKQADSGCLLCRASETCQVGRQV